MLSVADAEQVGDLGSEARGQRDGAGYAELPVDVFFYIVDGSWGDFQKPDQH